MQLLSDLSAGRLNRRYRSDTNRMYRPAVLGDVDGTIPDSQLPGNVMIRTLGSNGLSVGRSVSLGDDITIPYAPNTPIRLGKDRQRRDAAIGIDQRAYMAAGVNPVAIMQRQQSNSTPPANLEELRCVQASPPSLFVGVKSWNPIVAGIVYLFGGDTIDLTAAVPATGDMLLVVVAVMSDYATLEYAVSTARSVADIPLGVDDIQEAIDVLSAGSTPVWAIKLIGDQTTIAQSDIDIDGFDLRNMVNAVSTGGGGSTGYILIQEQQTSGTNGGTFTSGAWQTRALNTIVTDTTGAVTIGSNQFVLPAGTYRVTGSAPGFCVVLHKTRLQNISDSSTTLLGTSEDADDSNNVANRSFLYGRFTIASPKTFELQHRCSTTKTTNGFGVASSFDTEVYATIELIKE